MEKNRECLGSSKKTETQSQYLLFLYLVTLSQVSKRKNLTVTTLFLSQKLKTKKNRSKSQKEFFAKVNVTPGTLNEFKLSENSDRNIGDHLTADLFEVGQHVDVTGTSKGKGYAGVIKRHNFKMQDATHGNSLSHRAHGSIGQCQTPGRVWKGKKMSGHMGNERKTVQNLEIINVDVENNLLFIKGAIPGFNGSKVTIKPSIKK